jgi:hypothetical protein
LLHQDGRVLRILRESLAKKDRFYLDSTPENGFILVLKKNEVLLLKDDFTEKRIQLPGPYHGRREFEGLWAFRLKDMRTAVYNFEGEHVRTFEGELDRVLPVEKTGRLMFLEKGKWEGSKHTLLWDSTTDKAVKLVRESYSNDPTHTFIDCFDDGTIIMHSEGEEVSPRLHLFDLQAQPLGEWYCVATDRERENVHPREIFFDFNECENEITFCSRGDLLRVNSRGKVLWTLTTEMEEAKDFFRLSDGRLLVYGTLRYWPEDVPDYSPWEPFAVYAILLYSPEGKKLHKTILGQEKPDFIKFSCERLADSVFNFIMESARSEVEDLKISFSTETMELGPWIQEDSLAKTNTNPKSPQPNPPQWDLNLNYLSLVLLHSPTGKPEDCDYHLSHQGSREAVQSTLGVPGLWEKLKEIHYRAHLGRKDRELLRKMHEEAKSINKALENRGNILSLTLREHWEEDQHKVGTIRWRFPELEEPIIVHWQGFTNPTSRHLIDDNDAAFLCRFSFQDRVFVFQESYSWHWTERNYDRKEQIDLKGSQEIALFEHASEFWDQLPPYAFKGHQLTITLEQKAGVSEGPYFVVNNFTSTITLNLKSFKGKVLNHRDYDNDY